MEGEKERLKSLVSGDPWPGQWSSHRHRDKTGDNTDRQMAEARDRQMDGMATGPWPRALPHAMPQPWLRLTLKAWRMTLKAWG